MECYYDCSFVTNNEKFQIIFDNIFLDLNIVTKILKNQISLKTLGEEKS